MTAPDMIALLPFLIIAAVMVAAMMLIAFYRSHAHTVLLTMAGFAASFFALFYSSSVIPRTVTPLLVLDGYAFFYIGLILVAGFIVSALSYGYLDGRGENPEEFYLLLLLATLGAMVLAAGGHFVSFFLGLEILSVSLYSMIAYVRTAEKGNEAGIKYLVLAAVSAAFLLFGMALVYAKFGTMEFSPIAGKAAGSGGDPLLLAGFALIIVGIGFKLALVPFHMWTPDVYEGAPAPVTAFIATVSKGAVFALLLRYFGGALIHGSTLFLIFTLISIASMFAGNLLALLQQNVKRILAYSSIAHLGYLLVALLAGGRLAVTAVSYYLAAYFVTTLGAFSVITLMSGKERDADAIEDYRGLAAARPWLAGAFTAMLLSLAGIPLTAGFLGKFYVVAAGADSALWLLLVLLAVNSTIGLFYYLRIIAVMFTPAGDRRRFYGPVSLSGGMVTALLVAALFWLGIYPSFLIRIINSAVAGFI
jgi:NADH-quinone oxidoreductase subunit N